MALWKPTRRTILRAGGLITAPAIIGRAIAQVPMTGAGRGTPAAVASNLTVDNVGTKTYQASATSATYTGVNVTAGSNRGLVITLVFGYTTLPTGITVKWDNLGTPQNMTLIKSQTNGVSALVQLWGLSGGDGGANAQPTVGNGLTVAIGPWTNTAEVFIAGISFQGVNQTTPFPLANTAGVVSAHTYSLTSATGDKYVQALYPPGFGEVETGTVIYEDLVSGALISAAASYGDGAPTVTVGMATGTHNMPVAAAIDVKAA